MQMRHEWKHIINYTDYLILRQRLRTVLSPDTHCGPDGKYIIRSLYFDTPEDKALLEKLNGLDRREKFRIRLYNGDSSYIKLEKKIKLNGLGNKQAVKLSAAQTQAIIDGDIAWLVKSGDKLLVELYSKMQGQLLRPQTIVEYTREPFVYAPGNVRITLDYDLRTGIRCTDFLDANCPTIATNDTSYILEVKYDNFLPALVDHVVQLSGLRSGAFSKYAACRVYG